MNIIDRTHQYMAPGRSWYQRDVATITTLTVHHTADPQTNISNDDMLQKAANEHIANGWPGLAYCYFICPDGTIFKVNNHEDVTWHDAVNWDSIGIALQGYFHPSYNQNPTQKQLASLKWLLDELCTQHPEFPADQGDVYGHRERSATACPGDIFFPKVKEYRDKLGQVSWGTPTPTPTPTPSPDTFLGKTKEYWLQVEKDRENLMKSRDQDIKDALAKAKVQSDAQLATVRSQCELEKKTVVSDLKTKIKSAVDSL